MVNTSHEVRALARAHAPAGMQANAAQLTDVLDCISQDHATIRELFALYADTPPGELGARRDVTQALLGELELHTALETDVFYRAIADVLREGNRLRTAFDAHIEILALVRRLRATPIQDPAHATLMTALRAATEAHFDEEETHLFAGARECGVDLGYLGHLLQRRRAALALDGAQAAAERA